ncbi:protein kinase domain-containing protein [Streptomyces griseoruber]|uniref:Tat pathway signal protein n=1 Tax=Streptomyces griseoruber TaxID=1943 RepID=A0A101T5V3_9ACTN|nr:serine/threonine-protein kinase [Streptomyces griseoruber]KUN86433.1 Tat pathway signal protein [Streptomyces griseoruber]
MKSLRPEDPEQLGPYRLLARLGSGGMGRVYLARSSDGRTVAVKVIRPEMAEDRNFRIRFRREVAAAAAVGGVYTAPVVDAAPDAETPWLATAYVAGPTVAEAVAEHGPLPVETVLALGAGIAEALIAVHAEGLVHRDLKPSNVLLAADGPRVIDFGIVRARDGYELTGDGSLFGSLDYMCPEQATGEQMGPEGDVFCLGSVLAFAASGHPPFGGAAGAAMLYQVVHGSADLTQVPEPLDKIISLCHAKDPALRIDPDRLSAACAPGGAEQVLTEGWLPGPVADMVAARRAAAALAERRAVATDLARATGAYDGARAAEPAASADVPEPESYRSGRPGSAYATVGWSAYDTAVAGDQDGAGAGGCPAGIGAAGPSGAGEPGDGADRVDGAGALATEPREAREARPYGPGRRPQHGPGRTTAFDPVRTGPGEGTDTPAPERSATPTPHRARTRSRVSRRTLLTTAAAVGTALIGGAAVVSARRRPGGPGVRPAGPAPEPTWVYRGGPLLQAPAVFQNGTALLKTRPGTMIGLDVTNGAQPTWAYQGISLSPTPVLLTYGAAVALGGTGATLIGVDPAGGTEKFTLDFGEDYQFDQLLGSYDDYSVSVLGASLHRRSGEQGVATSTSTVFGVDLRTRQALVIPIDPEDVGVPLQPVITSDYFVYADGLRNVAARGTRDGGTLRWRHQVGYDLRPGLAVLGRTVFAIGSEFIALDLATGRIRWQAKAERGMFASLGAGGNTVYATGTDPHGVHAFNAANGTRRWFCETPRLNVDTPIAVGAHAVYVPAYENKDGFYAIDTASGRLLWNFTDGRETGVNDWQLSCDGAGHLVAQHFDRVYGLPVT